MNEPTWTDILQAIAAGIGIPAAIIGFIFFFKKDKDKQNQIKKLSDIASNLQDMVVRSEKRYVQTRKPLIDIKIETVKDFSAIKLEFHNFNQTSQVQYYEPLDFERKKYDIIVDKLNRKKQEFGILFYYDVSPDEYERSVIQIRYQMTEGYEFKQMLRFYVSKNKIEVEQDPILEMSAPDF